MGDTAAFITGSGICSGSVSGRGLLWNRACIGNKHAGIVVWLLNRVLK